MLPKINIQFQNGNLGQVVSSPDGVFGLLASATAVANTFELNKAYQVKSMRDVAALGISADSANSKLHKTAKEFYAEAGDGVELWLMGIDKKTKLSDWFDEKEGVVLAETLLNAAQGKLRGLFTAYDPDATIEITVAKGLDQDVVVAMSLAQQLAEKYTQRVYAPFFVLVEGYAFDGDKVALENLTEKNFNRIAVLLGDTKKGSKGAAVGVAMGRLASIGVQVNMGRVRDGALKPLTLFIGNTVVDQYDVEALNDKGYNSFRFHQGKAGYFMIDDVLATGETDDYRNITRRRTIDKAFRLVYIAMLDFLLDNSNVMPDGTISPIYAKTIENAVESTINNAMTAAGELSVDGANPNDRGVVCQVDLSHNVVSTGQIKMTVQVRPVGYNRFINVELGFVPVNQK
ncbi:hypothetical protein HX004_10170 [Myroides sp. 1354]|uniref:DUF2586 family protein n=1 Tax=unclassified Myroides TaxID=2642485 RepID=UPI002575B167|nr:MULTISPECIES: DUF2586 family protein [unclassified Myroides]MDM1045254.1 hypothetical protein [Myroides sp. R163-1]MDM1056136.1 hypothetical protein [Myroides sp. 1354]MDM1069265.1 hypothetical protein [Myroides sp. 1372]